MLANIMKMFIARPVTVRIADELIRRIFNNVHFEQLPKEHRLKIIYQKLELLKRLCETFQLSVDRVLTY